MKDIENRADIKLLVDAFYKKALKSEIIGHFFNEVIRIDFEKHMPKMYDFWETTLFHKTVYKGNPMEVHLKLDTKSSMDKKHFDEWIMLFKETVDQLFKGEKAELAKTRAVSISTVMQIKISNLQ